MSKQNFPALAFFGGVVVFQLHKSNCEQTYWHVCTGYYTMDLYWVTFTAVVVKPLKPGQKTNILLWDDEAVSE